MNNKISKIKGHGAMGVAQVLWGLNAPTTKLVLATAMTPLLLYDCRMIGAACLFWIASFFFKTKERVSKGDMMRIFIASVLAIILNQGMFLYGVRLTSPVNASIISTISPIITMVLAAIFLREPITGKKAGGVIIGGIGAIILIMNSAHFAGMTGNIWGDILCILAQTCYSCYLVFFKGLTSKYSAVTLMKWMFTFAAICVTPLTYSEVAAFDLHSVDTSIIYAIVFIIIGPTFISYLFLAIGQKTLRPTVVSSYNYIQPLVSSIVAIAWGLDHFSLLKTVAIVLIFTGVFMVIKSKSRAQIEQEQTLKT